MVFNWFGQKKKCYFRGWSTTDRLKPSFTVLFELENLYVIGRQLQIRDDITCPMVFSMYTDKQKVGVTVFIFFLFLISVHFKGNGYIRYSFRNLFFSKGFIFFFVTSCLLSDKPYPYRNRVYPKGEDFFPLGPNSLPQIIALSRETKTF